VREIRRLRKTNVPYEEIAVLYRINSRSADYEQAFHEAAIPFQVAGGGFLTRPAMRAALRSLTSVSTEIVATVERLLAQAQVILNPDPGELSAAELTRQQDLSRLADLSRDYEDGERTVREFAAHLRERFDSEQPHKAVWLSTYLVEGKSYPREFHGPGCGAGQSGSDKSRRNRIKIGAALRETQTWLEMSEMPNWMGQLYQSANRLAHVYWLQTKAEHDAWLVHLLFRNDPSRRTTHEEWKDAIVELDEQLGLAEAPPWHANVILDARGY
jgi:superfamily I DNA/RNA helicase